MIRPEMIQTFLTIVEYGNISAAANHMYAAQSNLSRQIKLLEEEVGVELIIRKKGINGISLTPYGEQFYQIARKWQQIMKEFDELKYQTPITEISIGALDRLNTFTLRDFYNLMLKEHDDIRLDIHTRHSHDIYSMMEAHLLDVGLVCELLPARNINIIPLYDEPMMVISPTVSRLPDVLDPKDLDPDKEIYSRWSEAFEIWHDQYWPGKQYRIHLGTTSMTLDYLNEPGTWSIVPVSVIHAMTNSKDITSHKLKVEPPKRRIYLLSQKNPNESRFNAISLFTDSLIRYLQKDPLIHLL